MRIVVRIALAGLAVVVALVMGVAMVMIDHAINIHSTR